MPTTARERAEKAVLAKQAEVDRAKAKYEKAQERAKASADKAREASESAAEAAALLEELTAERDHLTQHPALRSESEVVATPSLVSDNLFAPAS